MIGYKLKVTLTVTVTVTVTLTARTEEVGQAGRKASWARVSNSARDFIHSMAVVE